MSDVKVVSVTVLVEELEYITDEYAAESVRHALLATGFTVLQVDVNIIDDKAL